MIAAQYGKFKVVTMYRGQMRSLNLHVVCISNKPDIYFLFDEYGWAVDDIVVVDTAYGLHKAGFSEEISIN